MSMAAGGYFSVSSQPDAEQVDIAQETGVLKRAPADELNEWTQIYVGLGLDGDFARKVAMQLTEKDALGTHSRDELGISDTVTAHPVQAAVVSALTFAWVIIPLMVVWLSAPAHITLTVAASSIVALVVLGAIGAIGASAGGASMVRGAIRATVWGALAMAITAGVG